MIDPKELLAHRRFVRDLARALVADEHRAEDIAQETLYAALKSSPVNPRFMRSWLRKVVLNLSRRDARDRRRELDRQHQSPQVQRRASPVDLAQRHDLTRHVVAAVLDLQEPYRTTIIQHFYENLPPREIAARAGLPPETVRTHLHRAIQTLRGRLDRIAGGDRMRWRNTLLLLSMEEEWEPATHDPLDSLGSHDPADEAPKPSRNGDSVFPDREPLALLPRNSPTPTSGKRLRPKGVLWLSSVPIVLSLLLVLVVLTPGIEERRPKKEEASPIGRLGKQLSRATASDPSPSLTSAPPLPDPLSATGPAPARTEARRTGNLRVRVTRANGRPVPGVRATAIPLDEFDPTNPPPGQDLTYVTGRDGMFFLEDFPAGPLALVIGRMFNGTIAVVEAGKTKTVRAPIPRGVTIDGQVLDSAGMPVDDAEVYIVRRDRLRDFGAVVARTDPEGNFLIRDLTTNAFLGARAPGYAPSRTLECCWGLYAEQALSLSLVLQGPGATIVGGVLSPKSEPVPGARVTIDVVDHPAWEVQDRITHLAPPQRTLTDENGRFQFDSVWLGKVDLHVDSDLYAPHLERFDTQPEAPHETTVRLQPAATLFGTVRDEQGRVVPTATVSVTEASSRPFIPIRQCQVGSAGEYRLERLSPGSLTIHVATDENQGESTETLRLLPGEIKRRDVQLDREPGIRGRVSTEDGSPLSGWRVVATAPHGNIKALPKHLHENRRRAETQTDEQGRFFLSSRVRCPHRIEVFSPRPEALLPSARKRDIEPSLQEVGIRIAEETRPSAWVSGTLESSNGSPTEGLRVSIKPLDLRYGMKGLEASAERPFRFGPLVPGAYRLRVRFSRPTPDLHSVFVLRDLHLETGENLDLGPIALGEFGTVLVRVQQGETPTSRPPGVFVLDHWDHSLIPCWVRDESAGSSLLPGSYHLLLLGNDDCRIGLQNLAFLVDPGKETLLSVVLEPGIFTLIVLDEPQGQEKSQTFELSLLSEAGRVLWKKRDFRRENLSLAIYLSPGMYRVRAQTDAGFHAETEIQIDPDRDPAEKIHIPLRE